MNAPAEAPVMGLRNCDSEFLEESMIPGSEFRIRRRPAFPPVAGSSLVNPKSSELLLDTPASEPAAAEVSIELGVTFRRSGVLTTIVPSDLGDWRSSAPDCGWDVCLISADFCEEEDMESASAVAFGDENGNRNELCPEGLRAWEDADVELLGERAAP